MNDTKYHGGIRVSNLIVENRFDGEGRDAKQFVFVHEIKLANDRLFEYSTRDAKSGTIVSRKAILSDLKLSGGSLKFTVSGLPGTDTPILFAGTLFQPLQGRLQVGASKGLPFGLTQDEIRVGGGMFGRGFFAKCKEGHHFVIVAVLEAQKENKVSDVELKREVVDDKGNRYRPIGFGFPAKDAPDKRPFVMQQGLFKGSIAIAEKDKSILALFFVVPKDAGKLVVQYQDTKQDIRGG